MSLETAFGREGEEEGGGGGEGCSTFSFSRVVNTPRPSRIPRPSTGFPARPARPRIEARFGCRATWRPPPPLECTRRNRRREVQINRNVFIFHVSRPFEPNFFRLSTTGVVNLINQPAKLLTPTFVSPPFLPFSFEEFPRRVYGNGSPNLSNSSERKFDSLYRVYLSADAFSWPRKREINYSRMKCFVSLNENTARNSVEIVYSWNYLIALR